MNKKGLTIVELLLTIAILVSAVMVILVMGDRAVFQAGLFSAQTQATFLAKEGMEIVTEEVSTIEDATGSTPTYWVADYSTGLQQRDEITCKEKLKINTQGFYSLTGDTPTPFSRCITAVETAKGLEVQLEVVFDYRGESSTKLNRIFH